MNTLPPIADPLDGDGLGSYDTDELDTLVIASRIVLGLEPEDGDDG